MPYEILSEFITRTRSWAHAKRGREIFQFTAEIMIDLFKIDSGFVVYQKQIFTERNQLPEVHMTWGEFEQSTEELELFIQKEGELLSELFEIKNEQWFYIEELPLQIQSTLEKYNIQQFGVWPLYSRDKVVGAIVLGNNMRRDKNDTELITVCATQISLIVDMKIAWRTAEEYSKRDMLTGVYNRRGVLFHFEHLIASSGNVFLGIIDINEFKKINDTYGHPEGDRILVDIAQTLKDNVRTEDIVGRLGGDEFVLVIRSFDSDYRAVEQRFEKLFHQKNNYSVSMGFSVCKMDGLDWKSCYEVADKRLYEKKP